MAWHTPSVQSKQDQREPISIQIICSVITRFVFEAKQWKGGTDVVPETIKALKSPQRNFFSVFFLTGQSDFFGLQNLCCRICEISLTSPSATLNNRSARCPERGISLRVFGNWGYFPAPKTFLSVPRIYFYFNQDFHLSVVDEYHIITYWSTCWDAMHLELEWMLSNLSSWEEILVVCSFKQYNCTLFFSSKNPVLIFSALSFRGSFGRRLIYGTGQARAQIQA